MKEKGKLTKLTLGIYCKRQVQKKNQRTKQGYIKMRGIYNQEKNQKKENEIIKEEKCSYERTQKAIKIV